MSNTTPTTTLLVNKSVRTLQLEEIETGKHLQARLLSSGFDGKTWMGSCPAEGRKKACLVLFWRKITGEFIPAV